MTIRWNPVPGLLLGLIGLSILSGCAHRRESYYAQSPGVHVRAPFVDIRVPTGPRGFRNSPVRAADEPPLEILEPETFDWEED